MNLAKIILMSLAFCLILSFSVFAQTVPQNTAAKAVEDLGKNLKKYSRLQFQDLTIYFNPLDFDSCRVSYQYNLIENIGAGLTSSGNSSSPLAAYEQTRLKSPILRQTVTTGNYVYLPGRKNEIVNLMNVTATSNSTVVTSFDFRELDANSLKIEKRQSGVYLFFETAKGNKTIEKESFSTEVLPENNAGIVTPTPTDKKGEYLPIISQKKAEKVKELFSRAIKQCQGD